MVATDEPVALKTPECADSSSLWEFGEGGMMTSPAGKPSVETYMR
jgi:hypothetical protein